MAPSPSSHPVVPRWGRGAVLIGQLALVGVLVGIACWPLNLVDTWQTKLLESLPAFEAKTWTLQSGLLACSPLLVMPILLVLQADRWRGGSGSGIPQTITSLEDPEQADTMMASRSVIQRMVLWSLASLALFPLGREGPVVQMGAAVAYHLRRRWPRLLERLSQSQIMAIAAGAGLAGGFNAPLMGVVFTAEELTGQFAPQVIWPGLVVCALAAEVSNLGGEPLFSLGVVQAGLVESSQLVWGALLGVICGCSGGLFAWLILESSRWFKPRVRQHPWSWGVLLGALLTALAWLSGGASGGSGEGLMTWLINNPQDHQSNLITLLVRVLGPCLALGAFVPGGLIDPALTIGAVTGDLVAQLSHHSIFGVTLGMAGGLAGATQLPVMSMIFALSLAGDQQLFAGVLVSAVMGAYVGRLWMRKPIYHALNDLMHAKS